MTSLLASCRDQVAIDKLDVVKQDFEKFTCSNNDCGVNSIRKFVKDQLKINPAGYDVIVGLAETSPCSPIEGCSNGTDTIWVTEQHDSVTAHELGHINGLEDEYCSNQAGSKDPRCNDGDSQDDGAKTGDVNWLDESLLDCDCPPDGSNDFTGSACCNFGTKNCSVVNYGVCCLGNKNASGGRSTMSYANAPGPRGFDEHDKAYLKTRKSLACEKLSVISQDTQANLFQETSQFVLDISLVLHPNDSVDEENISITAGRPTPDSVLEGMNGDYTLEILDSSGGMLWRQDFSLYFDYFGPVVLDVDYSDIAYDNVGFSIRIPQTNAMHTLELYHKGKLIFSKTLPQTSPIYLPLILD